MPSPAPILPSPTSIVGSPTSSSSDKPLPRRRGRVSAEHTLNRVRENQRRHRARQRDHISSLEQKLAETEKLLEEARAEITTLKEEAAAASAICQLNNELQGPGIMSRYEYEGDGSAGIGMNITDVPPLSQHQQHQPGLAPIQPTSANLALDPQLDYHDVPIADDDLSYLRDISFPITEANDINNLSPADLSLLDTSSTSSNGGGPPPCCSDFPSPQASLDEPIDPECSTCKTRPPPDPSESTTLCAQAYVMISQQNFRNLDPDTIRLWLAQGLRRAQREGEGCRVENGTLMRLLDFMSGV